MKKNKALFLDRDGIINEVVFREKKHVSPRTFKEFKLKKGIQKFLQKVKKSGFLTIIVTNQPDIARGLMKPDELKKMHNFIEKELPIDEIFCCPHNDSDNCSCRKPKPGMLIESAKKWQIDLKNSFIVGDSRKDMDAGKNAGCKTILWQTNYNQKTQSDFKIKTFSEILKIII